MATVLIPHSWNQSARRWRSSVKVPNVRTGSEARSGPTAATCIFDPTSMAAARGWMGTSPVMGPACSYQSCQHLPVSLNSGRGWTAQDINFLTGITARRHHSQVRNNPWTTFFYGIIRHQKFVGRSPPPSDPTAGPFLWPQADRRPARVLKEVPEYVQFHHNHALARLWLKARRVRCGVSSDPIQDRRGRNAELLGDGIHRQAQRV